MNYDKRRQPSRRYQRVIAHVFVLKDPDALKYSSGEKPMPFTQFFVALGAGFGEIEEPAMNVWCRFKNAEFAVKNIKKGMELIVDGYLRVYKPKPEEGARPVQIFSISADKIEVVKWNNDGPKPRSEAAIAGAEASAARAIPAPAEASKVDEDVPF